MARACGASRSLQSSLAAAKVEGIESLAEPAFIAPTQR